MNKNFPRKKPSVLRPLAGLLLVLVSGLTAAWYFQWAPLRPAFLSVEVLLARLRQDLAAPAPSPADGTKPAPAAPVVAPQPTDPKALPSDAAPVAQPPGDQPPANTGVAASAEPPAADVKPAPAASPAPAPPPAAPKPPPIPPPWQTAFDAAGDVPDALTVCFDDFDPAQFLPQADDLKRWFEPVPGQRWTVANSRTKFGDAATVDGLARLTMPWRDDVALRLAVEKPSGLRIHFLHGTEGLTLAYYERDRESGWAAYASRRTAAGAAPEEVALLADDEGRTQRTGLVRDGGTFELRYREGTVTLSRGDVILLQAPLAGAPEQVLFEGKAVFRGIAAIRSDGFPAALAPAAQDENRPPPARLPWTEKLTAEGRFERSPDGWVVLAADKATAAGWVTTPLEQAGVYEVVLEVDQATSGAGLFLGRQEGEPREVLRFVGDSDGPSLLLKWQSDPNESPRKQPLDKGPVALAPGQAWIRLLYGCGVLRTWISHDGRHWAQPHTARSSPTGPAVVLGLHYAARRPDCRIRLRQVRLRTLPELAALADADLLARAPALHDAPQLGVWLTKVCEAQPPEADGAAWRRSCAVRTLGAGCGRDLGTALLELLLDDAADRGLPSERRLALLNEAALLWDTGDHGLLQKLLQRYRDLGRDAAERTGLRPYSSIRRDLMSVPLVTPHDVQVADEPTIRAELIQLAHENRLDELHAFCRQLHYFRQQDICPLRKWAEVISSRTTVGRMNWTRRATVSSDWQPPLIEELSKETYNAVAEMNALLESAAFDDAARLIASLDAEMFQGVAPHVSDRRLLASLPTAVGMALDAWPDLRAAVQAQYGEMAAFRVRRAIQENSLAAVQLATVQFAGLPAAAEAHRWLGDRALSIGWFDHALAQYRQAALSADAGDVRDLAARHRLAAAMLGRELGKPPASEIEIGGTKLTPAAFEELIAQLLKQNALLPAATLGNPSLGRAVPKPSGFAVQTRSRLDGPIGREPNAEVVPNSRRLAVDWAGRQIAAVLDVNAIYVSNRFQVAAYDPNSGARVWQSQTPDGNPMRSQDWGLIRMRPLVTADRIITRLLYGPQPMLACLDRSNGQLVWTVEFGAQEAPVSDPLWLQGRLGVLTLARQETGESLLRWTVLDPSSGVVISQNELLRLNEIWWRRQCCEVTPLDDGLVAILSGVTVCCDVAGNLRWIRRETVLPPSEEPSWVTQAFQGPLLAGNDLYALQPGGCAVTRLDVRSGRVAWSRLLPGAQRLLGLAAQRLIVQTDRGLLSLAAATGDSQWLHPVDDFLDAYLCDDATVLYARRLPAEDAPGKFRPQLVWLDAATGQPLAQTLLRGIEHEKPFLGPLVMSGDRLWAFFGRGDQDPTRDLIELVPQGEADKPPSPVATDPWTRHIPPPLQQETSRMLGDWRWLAAELVGAKPVEPNRWGEAESLGIRARRLVPATLGRRTSLPAGSSPKLRLRVGNDPNQPWNLEIRMNGAPVVRREFTAQTDPQPWKQLELDLSPAAGATGWLTIEAQTREGQETADVFWKQVEIVF
jgi:outer membrane protein assembly factor BamB